MEHFVAAHHVAGVAIAMHADIGERGGGVDVFNALEQVAGDGLVGREQAAWYEVAFKQGCQ